MKFAVENFKIFKERQEFDIKPITILVGPNGSGKSSVIKAVAMLKDLSAHLGISFKSAFDKLPTSFTQRHHFNLELKKADRKTFNLEIIKEYKIDEQNFGELAIRIEIDKIGNCLVDVVKPVDNEIVFSFSKSAAYLKSSFFYKLFLIWMENCNESSIKTNWIKKYTGSLKVLEKILLQLEDKSGNITININAITGEWIYKKFITDFVIKNIFDFVNFGIDDFAPLVYITTNRMGGAPLNIITPKNELDKAFSLFSKIPEEDHKSFKNLFTKYLSKEYLDLADKVDMNFDQNLTEFNLWKNGNKLAIKYLGFGVVNSLSILLNLSHPYNYFTNRTQKEIFADNGFDNLSKYHSLFAIEEPEMNLHPNAQSKLADVFANTVNNYSTTLIVETHSEYLIRKLQYLVAKKVLKPDQVQIYYFNDDLNVQKGLEKVYAININEDGSLTREFGPGFFDEADNIALDLFLLKQSQKN